MCYKCKTLEPAGSKYPQCSVCKHARYCSKACQTAHWPSHKVTTRFKLIIKANCAKWKSDLDQYDNPRLIRKFEKWHGNNFNTASSLVLSVIHPISSLRLEIYVAMISLKELPSGFQVLSAETALIESLSEERKKTIRGRILSNQTI
jgi:hypothetical protein